MTNQEIDAQANEALKKQLDMNEILVAEFEYVANTTLQNNEDRARVANYFFVSVGSLVAAIFGIDGVLDSDTTSVRWALVVLFATLSSVGILTLLQLSRLRKAWFDSVKTMNRIKDFYVFNSESEQLHQAFRWRTLPPLFKPASVSFLLALEVSMLSGMMFGAATMFLCLARGSGYMWSITLISGAAYAGISLLVYIYDLRG